MTSFDASVDEARLMPPGVWLSVSDLAQAKGVSKQAIAKRVARFEAVGEVISRPGDRRKKLVNVAAYDRLVGETGDIFRSQAPSTAATVETAASPAQEVSDPAQPSALAREQARRVAYQAELSRLDLEERLGKLVPIDQVGDAMAKCARSIVRSIDQLPSHADALAAAVAKDGGGGVRRLLREIARGLRATLEREMRLLEKGGDPSATRAEDMDEP